MAYVRCWKVKRQDIGCLEFDGGRAENFDNVDTYVDRLEKPNVSLVAASDGGLLLFVVAERLKDLKPAPYIAGQHGRSKRA